jgi:hypothetical protein
MGQDHGGSGNGSGGRSSDGALSKAKAMKFRTPYQTNGDLRDRINVAAMAASAC